jgi:uncharacterized membrane protein YhaH (DUF805 family)
MEWYIKVLKNYAVFDGRASRQEYWMFFLFNIIISFCLGFALGILSGITKTDQTVLGNIYSLAVLLPGIGVAIRRMHDTGRSGWWSIVPIMGLIYACEAGSPEANKYGPSPNRQKS